MDFGLVAKLPLVAWIGVAVTVIAFVILPRVGLVMGVLLAVPGVALMLDAGVRWAKLYRSAGTLLFVVASLWILAAAIGFAREARRHVPAGGEAASASVDSTTRLRPARFAA